MTIRTRFAPSPTGMLHIGGARTALFAWLYARKHGGEFKLRIEDTDRERSTEEATQVILDGMQWLGLDWDGDVISQKERETRHREAVEQLLDKGLAYRCYCSKQELDTMRENQRIRGQKPRYDGRCRTCVDYPDDKPYVIRFKAPTDGCTYVHDLILGDVNFQHAELDDLIILRSDGSPTYNLAVVLDDSDMEITHVIRGSDHLNNTPRQILLYQALDLPLPKFAHIPLIHGPDGAKMSKRHGAVTITEYKNLGYLADAMINYLARLGWSHGDDEIFTRKQLIDLFDLEHVGKTPSRFDQKKLDWTNGQHLRMSSVEKITDIVRSKLQSIQPGQGPALEKVVAALQERSKSLPDMIDGCTLFYTAPTSYDEQAIAKHCTEETSKVVSLLIEKLQILAKWEKEDIHLAFEQTCKENGLKFGKLAQPVRILLAGIAVSPPIDITLALLGKDETLNRLKTGLHHIPAR